MNQLLLLSTAVLSIWLSVTTAYNCTPDCKNGDCVAYLGNLSCQCYGNWSGDMCDQFVCDMSNPCMNNGICAVNPNNRSMYICACPFGYTGNRCQHKYPGQTSNCSSNSCGVNSTCYDTPETPMGFYCDCHNGYYGPTCNFTTDACANQDCNGHGHCRVIPDDVGRPFGSCLCPDFISTETGECHTPRNSFCVPMFIMCESGSVCETADYPINYTCTCPPDKTGKNCDIHFDVCAEPRCMNDGTCVPDGHYYSCSCPPNYTGFQCEYLIDPCFESACQNEGKCVADANSGSNGYYDSRNGSVPTHCECMCGYTGEQCNDMSQTTTPSMTTEPMVIGNLCTLNPCSNGVCTLDNSTLGFHCKCFDGFIGHLCDETNHCTRSPCNLHTSDCVSVSDSFVCVCRTGWGGEECDLDIDECYDSPCNGGTCNNIPGSYECVCVPGTTGPNCDRVIACDDLDCENGGMCEMGAGGVANCTCPEGYTGSHCQTEVCPLNECSTLAGNGVCNQACFRESCDFDGGDCFASPNRSVVTSPWNNCFSELTCRPLYSNGQCNVQCNTPGCLYDGQDCVPLAECPIKTSCEAFKEDGVCSPECNTADCPYDFVDCGRQDLARDVLVLIILANQDQPFISPWRDEFVDGLSKLTNSIAVITNATTLTREQLANLNRSLVIFPPGRLSEDPIIYKVSVKLDLQYCVSRCPTDAEDAAKWVQATIESGGNTVGPYGVADAYTVPDSPDVPTSNIQWLYAVVGIGVVAIIIVIAIVIIIGKRRRALGDTGDSGSRKVQARIWRPESPASESSRSSPPVDRSGRKSGSQALVSKDETPSPPEDPGKFIAEGSDRSKMAPSTGQSQISWQNSRVPIDNAAPLGSAPNDSTTVVNAQIGHDKRKWTPAHSIALHDPQRVRSLVDEYRKQNGSTSNVNARGPGGFTPLMLVVMKRHSSHETVSFPSRGSSESGSDHNDHSALIPTANHAPRMVSKFMNGGRPMSNSSVFSHDTGFYSTNSQVLPIDSSVSALLESKVDMDVANDYGQTALHLACACSRGDYVEQLLEAGANPNIQDNWGQSSLQSAIVAAAEGAFMLILNHPRTDLNLKSDGGITPLIAAVKVVNQFMVKQLLKKNVDIGATDKDGRTAVHWAAMVDNLEALKLLIRQGPDAIKDAQDGKGQTALFLACREGSVGCVKHLLDCFANSTLLDSLDQSPVQIAYQKQHMDIVEMLRTTAQGPFPMHAHISHMRGVPHMPDYGGYPIPPQYAEEMTPSQYSQLVHPKKSKAKNSRANSHARSTSIDSLGPAHNHTPTFISNVHPDGSYFGMPQSASHGSERHQTFGDLSMSAHPAMGGMQMSQFVPPHTYAPTTHSGGAIPPNHLPMNSVDVKKPLAHELPHPVTTSYLSSEPSQHSHPITPPDSAKLKLQTTSYSSNPSNSSNSLADPTTTLAVASTAGFDDIQAVSDLITSMADNPPVTSVNPSAYDQYTDQSNTPVYPETSVGASMRLQHLPLPSDPKQYSSGGSSTTAPDQMYYQGTNQTSPPQVNSVGSGSGSPSSVYPSPPHSNELQQQSFHGYQYSTSHATCSPPSLTPSPESREEALARQQFQHEIMTESYGTVLLDGDQQGAGHMVPHHHYNLGYPPLESSV